MKPEDRLKMAELLKTIPCDRLNNANQIKINDLAKAALKLINELEGENQELKRLCQSHGVHILTRECWCRPAIDELTE